MQGSLTQDRLPKIIHSLTRREESGVLEVMRRNVAKRLYFGEGSMMFARSDLTADRLGEFLVREGVMTDSHLAMASRRMRATGQMLGATLVEMGILSEAEMRRRVEDQVRAIVLSVIPWDEGDYYFVPCDDPVEDHMCLDLPTVPTILEGIRRVSESETIRRGLGDPDQFVSYRRDPWVHSHHVSLTPEEGFVLSRVDGQSTIADVVSISPLAEEETLRCLFALISAGFLEFGAKSQQLLPQRDRRDPIDHFQRMEKVAEATEPQPAEAPPISIEERLTRIDVIQKHTSLGLGSYYQWLGVQTTAKTAELKKAYVDLVKKYHPDRHTSSAFTDLKPRLETILSKLMEAYKELSDPVARRRYDNSLRTEAPRGESQEPAAAIRPEPVEPSRAETLASRYFVEARAYFKKADFHQTVKLMEEAVELDPGKAPYHRLLAKALAKNPQWRRQAEDHFQLALRLDPCDIESYMGLGELYDSYGMKSRAQSMFTKALALDPTNERLLKRLDIGRSH